MFLENYLQSRLIHKRGQKTEELLKLSITDALKRLIMPSIEREIRAEIEKCEQRHIREWSIIKSNLKDNLRDYIYQKTKRNPMILPIIMEV